MNAPGWTSTIEDDLGARRPRSRSRDRSSRAVLEAATGESFADLRYFRRRAATVKAGRKQGRGRRLADRLHGRSRLRALGRRRAGRRAVGGALSAAGAAYGIRPAGMLALDVVRLEAGLILLEVDYTSARHAMNPEQNYSPGEIGLGRLVSFDKADFVGRLALEREARDGGPSAPARRARSSTGTTSRGCSAPRACRRRSRRRSTGRTGPSSSAAARSAGRRRSAGARSSSRRSRSPRCRRRHEALGPDVDVEWTRRGPPRPRRRDGRRRCRSSTWSASAPRSAERVGRRLVERARSISPRSARRRSEQPDRVCADADQAYRVSTDPDRRRGAAAAEDVAASSASTVDDAA